GGTARAAARVRGSREGQHVAGELDLEAALARLREPLSKTLGPRTAGALGKLGLRTTEDLLRHYPRRYAAPGQLTDLGALRLGEHVSVMARVRQATVRDMRSRGGALLQATVTDVV